MLSTAVDAGSGTTMHIVISRSVGSLGDGMGMLSSLVGMLVERLGILSSGTGISADGVGMSTLFEALGVFSNADMLKEVDVEVASSLAKDAMTKHVKVN